MRERHSKVVRCIRRLLKGRDFGLFQETWLGKNDVNALVRDFPSWLIYYNNMDRNKGGVITMVRKSVARLYEITRVDLPEAATGRILVLRFTSRACPNDARAHFNLVNVYLSSGQEAMDDKLSQIDCLLVAHVCGGGL
jgi:exonuclease III